MHHDIHRNVRPNNQHNIHQNIQANHNLQAINQQGIYISNLQKNIEFPNQNYD